MTPVFLDSVGLLAIWDTSDQWHVAAAPVYEAMLAGRRKLVTTTLVLVECANAAARRPYRNDVADFRDAMESAGSVLVPTVEDWKFAWERYRRGSPGDAGFVDQVSFLVMSRLGLTDAFTNDRHFKAAGFRTLF